MDAGKGRTHSRRKKKMRRGVRFLAESRFKKVAKTLDHKVSGTTILLERGRGNEARKGIFPPRGGMTDLYNLGSRDTMVTSRLPLLQAFT